MIKWKSSKKIYQEFDTDISKNLVFPPATPYDTIIDIESIFRYCRYNYPTSTVYDRHVTEYLELERLKDGNIHMCFFSRSGYRPVINPPTLGNLFLDITLRSISFRCRFVFCVLILGLGLGFRVRFGIGNLKHNHRWCCRHSGHPRPLDACPGIVMAVVLGSGVRKVLLANQVNIYL